MLPGKLSHYRSQQTRCRTEGKMERKTRSCTVPGEVQAIIIPSLKPPANEEGGGG